MSEILVIGSLNMDLVVKANRMPEAGETLHGQEFFTIPGGKGANQAAAAGRLGGKTAMFGCVGSDSFGKVLKDNLSTFGVDTSLVRPLADVSSGVAMILVDSSGNNRIIVIPAANWRLEPDDIRQAEEAIRRSKVILMQFETPMPAVEAALEIASRHQVPVILNPAPAYPVGDTFLSKVGFLVLNESEARLLTGLPVTDQNSAFQAADALRQKGVGVVILTLGEAGALLVAEQYRVHIPTHKVKVVDTTAAGDCFVGGFAVSLMEGKSLPEAVRFANAAGTLAVTKMGAQTSIPSRQEVDQFLAQHSG